MSLLGTLVNAITDTKDDAKAAASSAAGQGESLLGGLAGMLGGGGLGNIAELAEKFHVTDILKEVGMPTDIGSIVKLAGTLGFDGDHSDHHGVQSWVKEKLVGVLADNGGKLPDHLKA